MGSADDNSADRDQWLQGLREGREAEAVAWLTAGHPEGPRDLLPEVEPRVREALRLAIAAEGPLPAEPEMLRFCVAEAVTRVLRTYRLAPAMPFSEEYLEVALRPVPRLDTGVLATEVCAILHDFHRGIWAPHLRKPQMLRLEEAVARALSALPAAEMDLFWDWFESADAMRRSSAERGLAFLTLAHRVDHLLYGLVRSRDHRLRARIVDDLETMADARAIPTLARMQPDLARTDWTLARQVLRVLRVLDLQNPGLATRTLLRSTSGRTPEGELVRPVPESSANKSNRTELLRPPD